MFVMPHYYVLPSFCQPVNYFCYGNFLQVLQDFKFFILFKETQMKLFSVILCFAYKTTWSIGGKSEVTCSERKKALISPQTIVISSRCDGGHCLSNQALSN